MFLPIGTERPLRRPTRVTYWLIGLNVGVHLVMAVLLRFRPEWHTDVLHALWLAWDPLQSVPWERVEGAPPGGWAFHAWAPFTYQFLHGGLLHLAGNMLFLWVFGPNVEDRLGRWKFAALYLGGGALAGLTHLAFAGQTVPVSAGESAYLVPPVIGASGAVAALTGAYLALFPKVPIRVLLFFIIIGILRVPAWWFIAFAMAKDIFFQGLETAGVASAGVAYLAHIGGYAVGLGVSLALLWWSVIPREPYDLFTLGRQARRRARFKEYTTRSGSGPWTKDVPAASKVRKAPEAPTEPKRSPAEQQKLTETRAAIADLLTAGKTDEAASAYVELLDEVGDATLSRDDQLSVANHLMESGRYEAAASAYRLFQSRYPRDAEAEQTRLFLAIIHDRYLNDPVGARRVLKSIKGERLNPSQRQLLKKLLDETG